MTMAGAPDRTVNYAFLLGGVTAAIFGIILLLRQDDAGTLLVVLLGLWWLIQGAFLFFSIFVDRTDVGWKLVLGLLGVVAGVMVLLNPGEATDVLKGAFGIVLGVIGVLVGISALFGAFRGAGFGSAVFGVVSIVIGVLILFNAQFTTDLLITLFAVLLLIDGVAAIYMAVRYR